MGFTLVLRLSLLCAALSATAAYAGDEYVKVTPESVIWRKFPLADGVQVAALYGAPDKAQIYTLRVKMEAGSRLKIHTHPDTRMITVLSGTLIGGQGTRYDASNETVFNPGSFFVVPAGTPHYTRAGEGEVIYQENGLGPSPTNLVE